MRILVTVSVADEIGRRWARCNDVEIWAETLKPSSYSDRCISTTSGCSAGLPKFVIACKVSLDLVGNPDAGTEQMCRIAEAARVPVRRLQVGDQLS